MSPYGDMLVEHSKSFRGKVSPNVTRMLVEPRAFPSDMWIRASLRSRKIRSERVCGARRADPSESVELGEPIRYIPVSSFPAFPVFPAFQLLHWIELNAKPIY